MPYSCCFALSCARELTARSLALNTNRPNDLKRVYQLHWLAGAMWISDDRGRKVTVWDLGKYYQGPFIHALKDWNIRPDVQAEIAAMKARRSVFTWTEEIDRIRQVCLNECEAIPQTLPPPWTSAHQCSCRAQAPWVVWAWQYSQRDAAKTRDPKQTRHDSAADMVEGVACAFFGGRAEISRSGRVEGPIYSYDISSAYPHHASLLPCLEHGEWERVTRESAIKRKGVAHALVHGHIHTRPRPRQPSWGALPVRLPAGHKNKGWMVFPLSGASGYWWRDEWLTAHGRWQGLKFDHAYVLHRNCDCKPFSFLPDLFARRRAIGKETGEGKILKLALNSCLGKLAQTISSSQFASRVWASMITSGTRAQVLKLMLRHADLSNVLMIATDGLFSTELHDVDTDIVLGGWERAQHDSITLVRPGIYWLRGDQVTSAGASSGQFGRAKEKLAAALVNSTPRVELARRIAFGGAKLCVRAVGASAEVFRSARYGEWH